MEQQEFERLTLMMVAAGIVLSVAEFLVISLVVGKGTIMGFQNGLLAGGGQLVAVVVLIWLATLVIRPEQEPGQLSMAPPKSPSSQVQP